MAWHVNASAWIVCMGVFVATARAAQKEPAVELGTEKGNTSMRIELETFVLPGPAGQDPAFLAEIDDAVLTDLQYSDLFYIERTDRYAGKPVSDRSLALVRGTVERAGASYRLRGRAESLPGNELIFQTEYAFSKTGFRDAAHEFADDIILRLMGEPGICRTEIVFSRREGGVKELWIIGFDGGDLRQLTSDRTISVFPSWAPSGQEIVFTTFKRDRAEIALLNLTTRQSRILSLGHGMNMGADWSPNGRWIAFTRAPGGDSDVFIMAADGTGMRPVAQSRGIDTSADWSPDGTQLAFVSDRSGNPQIYTMAVSGGGLQRLTFAGDYNDAPAWSPDGSWIAFLSRDRATMNLYVMRPNGDEMRPIVYGKGDCEGPSWAPDSRHLVYTRLQGGQRRLFVHDLKSERDRQLTTGPGDCYGPAWSPVPGSRNGLASSR